MRFLNPLIKEFRFHDKSNSGYIPKKVVGSLIKKLNPGHLIPRAAIDKYVSSQKSDLINFSDFVDSLTKNWIEVKDDKITFLKIICQPEN